MAGRGMAGQGEGFMIKVRTISLRLFWDISSIRGIWTKRALPHYSPGHYGKHSQLNHKGVNFAEE